MARDLVRSRRELDVLFFFVLFRSIRVLAVLPSHEVAYVIVSNGDYRAAVARARRPHAGRPQAGRLDASVASCRSQLIIVV